MSLTPPRLFPVAGDFGTGSSSLGGWWCDRPEGWQRKIEAVAVRVQVPISHLIVYIVVISPQCPCVVQQHPYPNNATAGEYLHLSQPWVEYLCHRRRVPAFISAIGGVFACVYLRQRFACESSKDVRSAPLLRLIFHSSTRLAILEDTW